MNKDEIYEKERVIFDIAMHSIEDGHWNNVTLGGNLVTVKTVDTGKDDLLFDDFDKVKEYLKSPLCNIHSYSE